MYTSAPSKYDGFIRQIKEFDPVLGLRYHVPSNAYHVTHVDVTGKEYCVKSYPMVLAECINAQEFINEINHLSPRNRNADDIADELEKGQRKQLDSVPLDHYGVSEMLGRLSGTRINNVGVPS